MGKERESIRQSIARIVKYSKSEIDEGNVILASVNEVFSDILDVETFGTMSVTLQPSEVEIPDVPLNAHINDDGSTSISGKYTFPKVNSDVFLILDYKNGIEYYYPIFFSHVDKVYEQYDSEKVSRVVEVDTPNENKPYETTETGNFSERTQSASSFDTIILDEDGNNFIRTESTLSVDEYVGDGSNVTSTVSNPTSRTVTTPLYKIDTDTASSEEPAVLGDSLITSLESLIEAFAPDTPVAWVDPNSGIPTPAIISLLESVKSGLSNFLATNIKLK